MNNLLSYCGLADARISASEKDLPVAEDGSPPTVWPPIIKVANGVDTTVANAREMGNSGPSDHVSVSVSKISVEVRRFSSRTPSCFKYEIE